MWSRKELKENAKVSLKANYWKAFLASLITAILGGAFAASRKSMTDDEVVQEFKTLFGQQSVEDMAAIIAGLAAIVFITCIISFIITIFLKNPLLIGSQKLLLNCKDSTASARDILFAFKLGWHILGLITFGIAELFYVLPYHLLADTELYYN